MKAPYMDTMKTTADILTFNGSVRPAMVALTPNELALIAEAPAMADVLIALLDGLARDDGTIGIINPSAAKYAVDRAAAILARIKGAA